MTMKDTSKMMLNAALLASFVWTVTCTGMTSEFSPFKVIIDGGSTGSRLHIFEFVQTAEDSNDDAENDENDAPVQCVRRGSSRANVPLSAFGRLPSEQHDGNPLNATEVADHLLPLFEYAATVIPPEYHETTQVKYQATAGMRLLSESEQDAVYDALYDGLMDAPSFVFRGMKRDDIATLSGQLEGFYGAVAANYLQGLVDANLRLQSSHEHGPVGALDMGGSSTQIVFLPDDSRTNMDTCTKNDSMEDEENKTCSSPYALNDDHFFSTSYLSYGVDQFRERLWTTLVQERADEMAEDSESCGNKFVPNPCANKGYEVEWNGFTLVGTGDTEECIRQTKRLIPHPEIPHDNHGELKKQVGGVEHPPVRGKFLAMSLYFFSLDSLRVFSQPDEDAHRKLNSSWPNPSIEELHNALDGLCSRDWHGDMEFQHGAHDFTRPEVLPHRCIETVFMVTLLKDGYGFHPSSRDITFTFLLDGDEVEWTMGMALSMNAGFSSLEEDSVEPPCCNATWDEIEDDLLQTLALPFIVSENTHL